MILSPPLSGADHFTVTPPKSSTSAVGLAGIPGAVLGVAPEPLAFANEPVPAIFTAATWNVYEVPLLSLSTFTEVEAADSGLKGVNVAQGIAPSHDCTV